ncbi:MAG: DNA polymerase III subunit epsilon [Xanthomonadales bacterium]|nr:DNA polymerase III subunit epsilon [Xanthomonadales bacterium]
MRQIILDTETTGLEAHKGHRIVEVGCIEMVERRRTGKTFHRYFNPQREMDEGARRVTGLDDSFLAGQPLFASAADELAEFLRDAELIIHNASFDVGFLDAEFARCAQHLGPVSQWTTVTDTLALARERYPGQRNSLDALCKRLGVDNTHRSVHGALLDAELLAEVYLSMTAGQGSLGLESHSARDSRAQAGRGAASLQGAPLRVLRANAEELAAHHERLAALRKSGSCLWGEEPAQNEHESAAG